MSAIMSICPKCARFKVHRMCPFCDTQQIVTETTLEEVMKMTDEEKEKLISHYIETLIKDTYNPKAREYREANEKSIFAGYIHNPQPKCPTCQSTNIRKISGVERGTFIWTFGLFSNKINKTFKCNSCGYTW